jgi:hypothetical protein
MTAGGEVAVRWWRGRLEVGFHTEINMFGHTGFGVIGFEIGHDGMGWLVS